MEHYYSGEELAIKPRKPYTITKQRERWTEEEHNRFLEALKLHGRAWQRIEEHIGTKTAVQIRSHAQKFFTKLEKEAVVKGVPKGKSLEIEIPPPRPKRKPSNPYPRKTTIWTPSSQAAGKDGKSMALVSSSLQATTLTLDLEMEPACEKSCDDEKLQNPKKLVDEDNSSEVYSSFREATCAPLSSSTNKNSVGQVAPRNPCAFKEFVPMLKEVTANQDETNESYITIEPAENHKLEKLDPRNRYYDNSTTVRINEKLVQKQKSDEQTMPDNLAGNDIQATTSSHNYPRHVPVHVVDGKQGVNIQNVSPEMHYQLGQVHGPFTNISVAASVTTTEAHKVSKSSVHHQSFPTFHPLFSDHHYQDDYQHHHQSVLHSTFSSLVVSSLLQNPAAHAAASIAAASLYPAACSNVQAASAGDTHTHSAHPSMTALAAATVAAATAWWAAHGLLPPCSIFDSSFTGNPVSAAPGDQTPATAAVASDRREEVAPDTALQNQELDPQGSEALGEQNSSDSDRSNDGKQMNTGMKTDAEPVHSAAAAAATELHDSNKTKSRKQVDRSSCGSNTASSSEVETDALRKHEKGKEDCKELDASNTTSTDSNRRGRISSNNATDSWKEVSQGGRLAFQALFSRERLPQSFSPPYDLNSEGQQKCEIEKGNKCINENWLQLDLNCKIWGDCLVVAGDDNNNDHLVVRSEKNGNDKEGMLTKVGAGLQHHHRTAGFKPYKRCSIEANKESRVASTSGGSSPNEEKNSKRIRLE